MNQPYRIPPKFPFNPLKVLRLALSLGPDQATVETIFRCIWEQGLLPEDEQGWQGIVEALGVSDADDRIADPAIKEKLHENGRWAVEAGVFGVPLGFLVIVVVSVTLLVSLAIYGSNGNFNLAG